MQLDLLIIGIIAMIIGIYIFRGKGKREELKTRPHRYHFTALAQNCILCPQTRAVNTSYNPKKVVTLKIVSKV